MALTGLIYNTSKENDREQWRRSLAEAGLTLVDGSFEEGADVTSGTDAIWYMAGAQCYTWGSPGSKAVPARSTPATTGGVGLGAWVSVGDASLRSDLLTTAGAEIVYNGLTSIFYQLKVKLSRFISDPSNATAGLKNAIAWAVAQNKAVCFEIDAGDYILTEQIVWDGANQIFFEAMNSGAVSFSWTASSASQGFKIGETTPVERVGFKGITFVNNAVSAASVPAVKCTFDGSSPKSLIMTDCSCYGGSVGGTESNGYWKGGFVIAKDPVYPVFKDLFFFGIGGTASVAKSNKIESVYRVTSSDGVFFTNFFNCFGNNANIGIHLVTLSNPGIEGSVIQSCNFNSVNVGVFIDASGSGVSAYFPPQVFILNSQFEFLQRGVNCDHCGKVIIGDCLFYTDPTADDALTAILLTDVQEFFVRNNFIDTRNSDTGHTGIVVTGASINGIIHDNLFLMVGSEYAISVTGTSSNIRQHNNYIRGNNNLYSNTSSNKATNTSEPYSFANESSHQSGEYIEKFGSRALTLGADGSFTVNFIVAFPTSALTIVACNGNGAAGTQSVVIDILNATGFTGRFVGGTPGTARQLNYIVKGK